MSRKVDLGMARKFLSTLAPGAVECAFQTFSDNDSLKIRREVTSAQEAETHKRGGSGKRKFKLEDPHARVIVRSFNKAAKTLAEKNALGVGVFVAVNEMDGRGRRLENFKRFRAVFADMDADKCKTTSPKWPLKPSIVVASNGGRNRHFYWLLDGEMDVSTWKACGQQLVQKYGADANATDLVRVLRLPGFFHCKGKPAMVKLLECSDRRYTAAELAEAFPAIKRKTKKRSVTIGDGSVDIGALRSALAHLVDIAHPRSKHSETYADDYDTWIRFGLAIKRGLGDHGFAVWDDWAQTSSRYDKAKSREKWNSFDVDGREGNDAVTVGTIFDCAKRHGWSFAGFRIKSAFEAGLAALKAERGLA